MEVYDEIEIEDLDYEEEDKKFYYQCPCGDFFETTIVKSQLFVILKYNPHALTSKTWKMEKT